MFSEHYDISCLIAPAYSFICYFQGKGRIHFVQAAFYHVLDNKYYLSRGINAWVYGSSNFSEPPIATESLHNIFPNIGWTELDSIQVLRAPEFVQYKVFSGRLCLMTIFVWSLWLYEPYIWWGKLWQYIYMQHYICDSNITYSTHIIFEVQFSEALLYHL